MGFFDAVLGVAGNLFGASMQNSATEGFQQVNIDWQREQLQNKHQWEVEDLRKAGLNPILSAANSSSAVSAGSPEGANPGINLTKMLNEIANSALAKKQEESVDYQNTTDRIKAEAEMLKARQEEARTASTVDVNKSQTKVNLKTVEMADKNYELNKLYREAQVREIDQRIINSVMEVKAKIEFLRVSGQAALISANAAQMSAQAAMQNAATNRIIAEVAEKNGISFRALNDAMSGKAYAETLESYDRAANIQKKTGILDWQLAKDKIHNPYVVNDGIGRAFMGAGEILRNGISGAAGFIP